MCLDISPLIQFNFGYIISTVSFAEWSFDGNYVVSSSWDRNIIVWDVEKAKSIANYIGHEEEVLYICCHPSQSLFLSTSADSSIRLWDMRTGTSPSVEICKAHNGFTKIIFYLEMLILRYSLEIT
ncbi:hypothetical protein MXB_3113 [Myxobolus squamalis]|nr:hypothetical protein MXB_3113 [Myxobolus squamalis]